MSQCRQNIVFLEGHPSLMPLFNEKPLTQGYKILSQKN